MTSMREVVLDFFKQDEWPFREMEGQPTISVNFAGKNGTWTCYARIYEDKDLLIFYSYCPVKAPPDKRPIIADYLTRANYGISVGNFEMDYNDGEMRYKTSIDVEGDELTTALVKRVVYANVSLMDKYLPGIMSVIYGGSSPTEAIAQVEG